MDAKGTEFGGYVMGRRISSGSFGTVRKATHVLTGETVAVKVVNGRDVSNAGTAFQSEIEALSAIDHPHVIRYLDHVKERGYVYLVMEYINGMDLADLLAERGRLTDDEARSVFVQVVEALCVCHIRGIAHRDIKLENVMLCGTSGVAKLVDFGFAKVTTMSDMMRTQLGSVHFAAPELLRESQDGYAGTKVDMWALGVLLYAMVCGAFPFDSQNAFQLRGIIARGKYTYDEALDPPVSRECQETIAALLRLCPDDRPSCGELLQMPFLRQEIEHGPYLGVDRREIRRHSSSGSDNASKVLSTSVVFDHPNRARAIKILTDEYKVDAADLAQSLQERRRDDLTCSYFLVLQRLAREELGDECGEGMAMQSLARRSRSKGDDESSGNSPSAPQRRRACDSEDEEDSEDDDLEEGEIIPPVVRPVDVLDAIVEEDDDDEES